MNYIAAEISLLVFHQRTISGKNRKNQHIKSDCRIILESVGFREGQDLDFKLDGVISKETFG